MSTDDEELIQQYQEHQARQALMNIAFYNMLNDHHGGEHTVRFSDVKVAHDMGSVGVEIDYEAKTVTFKTVTREELEAFIESKNEVKQ